MNYEPTEYSSQIDLSADRITWSRLTTAQIEAVRNAAGSHGDTVLVRKADRALARRGGAA